MKKLNVFVKDISMFSASTGMILLGVVVAFQTFVSAKCGHLNEKGYRCDAMMPTLEKLMAN